MSKRNSQDAKRAARERLRVEREQQAKKEKVRRQVVVAGSIVGTLAIVAGIGVAVANMGGNGGEGDSSDWGAAEKLAAKAPDGTAEVNGKQQKYTAPANTGGENGTEVVVGDKKAAHTLGVYEDMRCPICSGFEQANGETIAKDMKSGKYRVSFTFGTFLDNNPAGKGTGSKNALSALGAALNVSPEAFLEYKKVLFSKEHHPEETDDAYANDQRLIDIAQKVDGLKGNAGFEKAVNEGTYDAWALQMSKRFDKSGVEGTPALKFDGKLLEGNTPQTPEQLNAVIDQAIAKAGKGAAKE